MTDQQPACPAEYVDFEIGEEVTYWNYGRGYFIESAPRYVGGFYAWEIDVSFGARGQNIKPVFPGHLHHLWDKKDREIERLTDELTTLRATVEALTAEKDETRALLTKEVLAHGQTFGMMNDEFQRVVRERNEIRTERDGLKQRLEGVREILKNDVFAHASILEDEREQIDDDPLPGSKAEVENESWIGLFAGLQNALALLSDTQEAR